MSEIRMHSSVELRHAMETVTTLCAEVARLREALAEHREAVRALAEFQPREPLKRYAKWQGYPHDPEDDDAPMMSEAHLYLVYGKHTARSILSLWNRIAVLQETRHE